MELFTSKQTWQPIQMIARLLMWECNSSSHNELNMEKIVYYWIWTSSIWNRNPSNFDIISLGIFERKKTPKIALFLKIFIPLCTATGNLLLSEGPINMSYFRWRVLIRYSLEATTAFLSLNTLLIHEPICRKNRPSYTQCHSMEKKLIFVLIR